MRLESVNNTATAELRKIESTKRDNPVSKASAYSRRADSMNISADAKKLSETSASAGIISARLQAEPDIRSEKIDEVRKKMEEGFYRSPDFTNQLADKLIGNFG